MQDVFTDIPFVLSYVVFLVLLVSIYMTTYKVSLDGETSPSLLTFRSLLVTLLLGGIALATLMYAHFLAWWAMIAWLVGALVLSGVLIIYIRSKH